MGALLSKYRRKRNTSEELERICDDIRDLETFSFTTQQQQTKVFAWLVISTTAAVLALLAYMIWFAADNKERLTYLPAVLLLPTVLVFSKKGFSYYYTRKLKNNDKKIRTLRENKKKILEDVMNTETYKVAKELLEKYAPEQLQKTVQPYSLPARKFETPESIRQRAVLALGPAHASRDRVAPMKSPQTIYDTTPAVMSSPSTTRPPSVPTPINILPRDRSVLDRMVDYIIGDGPNNRYALICSKCHSHNGMALKEEFEYISFKCCYCYAENPARKIRPSAPKLDLNPKVREMMEDSESNSSSSSTAEKISDHISDSDSIDLPSEEEEDVTKNVVNTKEPVKEPEKELAMEPEKESEKSPEKVEEKPAEEEEKSS